MQKKILKERDFIKETLINKPSKYLSSLMNPKTISDYKKLINKDNDSKFLNNIKSHKD